MVSGIQKAQYERKEKKVSGRLPESVLAYAGKESGQNAGPETLPVRQVGRGRVEQNFIGPDRRECPEKGEGGHSVDTQNKGTPSEISESLAHAIICSCGSPVQ
jgi:hypothetical protein